MSGPEQDDVVQAKPGVDTIARQLTGELICIGCGYDLRGLSIRDVCPECEAPIKATLLGIVDPKAEELEELISPWWSANGLVMMSSGALIACIAVWLLRIEEIIRAKLSLTLGFGDWLSLLGMIGLIVSALGAVTLIRPHRQSSRMASIRAAIGVSAYIPVAMMYWVIYQGLDRSAPMPLIQPGDQSLERSLLRLGMFVGVVVIVVGIRPMALMLAMRSVIVRTGRVDRQSMYALLASFGVAAIGDACHVTAILNTRGVGSLGILGDLLMQLHVVLVALGSVLITLGMINILIDTVRIRPVLIHKGVGLSDVFETNQQKHAREQGS